MQSSYQAERTSGNRKSPCAYKRRYCGLLLTFSLPIFEVEECRQLVERQLTMYTAGIVALRSFCCVQRQINRDGHPGFSVFFAVDRSSLLQLLLSNRAQFRGFEADAPERSATAVSYTHLDVYKRQA